VLATVNGVPILDGELLVAATATARKADKEAPDRAQTLLDTLIQDELLAQKALAMGLDQDPHFAEKFALTEAQHAITRRKALAAMAQRALAEKTTVADAEAQKFYNDNAVMMRTEVHILQTARHGQAAMDAALGELKAGKTFDQVAASAFGTIPPEAKRPWDLGWLHWGQLPHQWRPVVPQLAAGGTAPPMPGTGDQLWLVQVAEKRENPALTFEKLKQPIMEWLRFSRTEEAAKREAQELKARAQIRVVKPPVVITPPRLPEAE
jgi:hypothetical protein